MKSFCYLGDKVNASGGCEAAVTARARIDLICTVVTWSVLGKQNKQNGVFY